MTERVPGVSLKIPSGFVLTDVEKSSQTVASGVVAFLSISSSSTTLLNGMYVV